jgi:hypothetical protein
MLQSKSARTESNREPFAADDVQTSSVVHHAIRRFAERRHLWQRFEAGTFDRYERRPFMYN